MMTDAGFIAERRPEKGLLGGMLGLPHLEWRAEPWQQDEILAHILCSESAVNSGSYDHIFTHFALSQTVMSMRISSAQAVEMLRIRNDWQLVTWGNKKALPTVFGKALKLVGK